MEHIIQFAISMEDEAIKAQVAKNAEKAIIENIQKDVEAKVFEIDRWCGSQRKIKLSEWTERVVEAFLEKHKDKIIDLAARLLADKLARSKAGKAILEGIVSKED